MKRRLFVSSLILSILILGKVDFRVDAQSSKCISSYPVSRLLMPGLGNMDIDPISGATVTVTQSVHETYVDLEDIKNVVVIGQDPAEEGVSITVAITGVTGKIQHDEKWNETICKYFSSRDDVPYGAERCNPLDVHYYSVTEERCERYETPATRKIKAVRIWLELSTETTAWLGWGDMIIGGRASLRYMFPDKWMTGTWTPEGFVTSGTLDKSWSVAYYERWLAQQSGYNFFAGDASSDVTLWSVTLAEVGSPQNPGTTSLGLLGAFAPGDIDVNTAPVGAYTVSYTDINSNTDKHRAALYPQSLDPTAIDAEEITINLVHIPLDLPGIWNIGVWVQMELATTSLIYGKPITETPDPSIWGKEPLHWFENNESGYNMVNNYFYAYVLLSTPCNPLEDKGCWDGSW
jgi:hypothetical protein